MNLPEAFLAALGASFVAGFAARAILGRVGIMDRPNERSSHERPVVRGGGVGVLLSAALVAYLAAPLHGGPVYGWIALGAFLVASVSFLDDLRSVPRSLRLGVQAAAAVLALRAVGLSGMEPMGWAATAVMAVVAFLWVVGYTNAFNFMDGINGIAAMQVVTTGVGTALVALEAGARGDHPAIVLSVALAGAGAGFLPHNFPRARMFLGDVGSASLGFLLAILAFWLAHDLGWWLLGAFGLLHANFILDAAITLARRILNGERWLEPHRAHFYQRLVRSGQPHALVSACEGLLQVLCVLVVLACVRLGWTWRIAAAGTVCAIWIAFFLYAECRFRRHGDERGAAR